VIDLNGYVNKNVPFKFKGVELKFDLSHALFSSFDIDVGTRLLLKTTARDPVLASSRRILDEGCGVGVIGLCAAKAFPDAEVLLRDRDGLAVAFTERNRIANKLRGVSAWTDPRTGAQRMARPAPRVERGLLGDGREGGTFDFVFSNLPAKAGAPVLKRFFDSLSGKSGSPLLVGGGRAGVVIVNPLAEAAAEWIAEAGLSTVASERGSMHRVFVVERQGAEGRVEGSDEATVDLPLAASYLGAYLRGEARFKLADLAYRASGYWGLPEFDTPGYGASIAAELASRACKGGGFRDALFIEPGVGHLAIWASRALGLKRVTAASRDYLSLWAVDANLACLGESSRPAYTAIDALGATDLPRDSFDLVVESPDIVPERDWIGPSWDLAGRLLRAGGFYLAYCSSTEMTRLEKRRPEARHQDASSTRPPDGPTDGGEGGAVRWTLLGQRRKKAFVASVWRKRLA
jgi:hypothetical protein